MDTSPLLSICMINCFLAAFSLHILYLGVFFFYFFYTYYSCVSVCVCVPVSVCVCLVVCVCVCLLRKTNGDLFKHHFIVAIQINVCKDL